MKKEFKITGMRCNNCRTNVERAIKAVEGVESATVTLEPGKAKWKEISMKRLWSMP